MSTHPPINVCDALKNTGFQSSIARHTREFCWGFDETKITVFDRILQGNPIEAFLEGRCKHTKDWFTHGKARPDALGYRKHLFSQFKTHVNPFTALVRDIKVCFCFELFLHVSSIIYLASADDIRAAAGRMRTARSSTPSCLSGTSAAGTGRRSFATLCCGSTSP